jgi:hypothetical protein
MGWALAMLREGFLRGVEGSNLAQQKDWARMWNYILSQFQ